MFKLKKREIYASEIAEFMNSKLNGSDFIVTNPATLTNITNNSFTFLPEDKKLLDNVNLNNILIICSSSINIAQGFRFVLSETPKLDFIRAINEFFLEIEPYKIASSTIIHPAAKIANNVSIGNNCILGEHSVIGNNTQILNNVVIGGNVEIGYNCLIKDNSTIGSEGYNFEFDEDGMSVHYPNIGKVSIGNSVWIGSNTTIESSGIMDTVIHDFVKIDDLVHIGSGCVIGTGSMITAGTILSINVIIGKNTWIAPNVTVKENIKIGDNCILGAGSVVIKDISENMVVVGNPGHLLRKNN